MYKRLLTAIAILLLSALPSVSAEPLYSIEYSRRVKPGSIYSVRFQEQWRYVYREMRVVLADSGEETLVEGRSFLLDGDASGEEGSGEDGASESNKAHAVVLMGIPSTLSAGEYELRFFGIPMGNSDEAELIVSDTVTVAKSSFDSMNIVLKESLTDLRRSPDSKKREQAREIHRVYGTFNRNSVYETERWKVPLGEYKYITGSFGDRRVYEYSDGSTAQSVHNGVDLAAAVGTPVMASAAGRVVLAEDRVISGESVVIEHLPGLYSIYFHLDSLDVEEGDHVVKGERIGTVGMTGLATGPHLHWEVRLNGEPVDPWELTKSGIFETISALERPLTGPEESEGG